MSKKPVTILIVAILLSISNLASKAYGQSQGTTQFAANNAVTSIAKETTDNGRGPTEEMMRAEIRSQQLELNELRDRVKKLEEMLGAIADAKQAAVRNLAPPSLDPPIGPPSPAPAPAPRPAIASARETTSRELLPDIGQIGAEVGLLVGGSQNPFKSNEGFFAGGFIDLPLRKVKGGKISYEVMISAQRTNTTTQATSGVIALVNSALNSALGTPPSVNNLLGPLPVTNRVRERLTVLTVVPASFKYTLTSLDHYNIRPYFVAGLGTYVGLSSQSTFDFDANRFINNSAVAALLNSLLSGAQVGGLIPIAPELRERGVSNGQGDFRFGLNAGGGVEFRISPKFSMGFDYRVNKIEGRNSTFSTFAFKPTVHF